MPSYLKRTSHNPQIVVPHKIANNAVFRNQLIVVDIIMSLCSCPSGTAESARELIGGKQNRNELN